ncbi:MAG: VCBS repeat-containing protein [Thermoanaerobaculia bacterium]
MAIGSGDFDRDGRADLVGSLSAANAVALMLGGGDGTLGIPRTFPAGSGPQALVVADFDADGGIDVAVANTVANTVSVLRGDGAGGLGSPLTWPSGSGPAALGSADFDHDGRVDLAVANRTSNDVTIILAAGVPGAGPVLTYSLPLSPNSLAVGDFNADGHADIATANGSGALGSEGTISVLLGGGDGTFVTRADYSAMTPANLRAADVNGDGRPDLIATNATYSDYPPAGWVVYSMVFLLAAADGSFAERVSMTLPEAVTTFVAHDFTRDGRIDLALNYRTRISVLPGNGDGTFGAAVNTAGRAGALTMGDFDGDGNLDLAATMDSSVALWLANGNGTFRTRGTYARWDSLAVADFNGDGMLDVAAMEPFAYGRLFVLLGTGDGGFTVAHQAPSVWSSSAPAAATADFNRDGRMDLVVANGPISVLFGMPDGSLGAATEIRFLDQGTASSVATGDLNGDGKPDLAVTGTYYVAVVLGNGDGTFAPAVTYDSCSSTLVGIADFTADAKLDLVVDGKNCGTGVLRGNGDGTFERAIYSGSTGCQPKGTALIVGDFNRDGRGDVLLSGPLASDCSKIVASILLGNGDGTFTSYPDRHYYLGRNPVIGDFNADGIADLVLQNGAPIRNVSLLAGVGDGTFGAPVDFETTYSLWRLAGGDFDGDGRPDLFASQNGSSVPVVLMNSCSVPIAPSSVVATALFAGASASLRPEVLISWSAVAGASSYQIFRSSSNAPFALAGTSVTPSFTDHSAAVDTTYLYFVKAVDAANDASAASNVDLATTIYFGDDPLVPRTTPIRYVHVTQLRTAINAVRAASGLGPATFTDPVERGRQVRAAHIAELRPLIDAARLAIGLAHPTYSGSVPSPGMAPRASDIEELRSAVK